VDSGEGNEVDEDPIPFERAAVGRGPDARGLFRRFQPLPLPAGGAGAGAGAATLRGETGDVSGED